MNANELRIGNWIADRGGKNWQIDYWESKNKVSAKEPIFNTQGFEFSAHPFTEYVDFLKPIQLTEKWLLDFGFKDGVTLDNDKYKIDIDYYDGWIFNYREKDKFGHADVFLYPSSIYYVHQLQNLFFSLTNEELTIINE